MGTHNTGTRMPPPPNQFGKAARPLFSLAEDIAHLNHGSYGATPRELLMSQRAYQDEMEREPSGFMQNRFPGLIRRSARAMATYIHANADQIALVENATTGVNAVLDSLTFQPGDEILITDQTYGAVRNTVSHVCARTGAKMVCVSTPFPDPDDAGLIRSLANGLSEHTKLVIIDHVTSPTALVLPVAKLAAVARTSGARILIDGAHAPGMVPLNLSDLDCDYYTGNCHKWLCAPKGSGFLWAATQHLGELHPTVISHGFGGGFLAEFDWIGTRDASAQFVLPDALAFLERRGETSVREHNTTLVTAAANMLSGAWGTRVGASEAYTGSMAMVELPIREIATPARAHEIRGALLEDYQVQVPIMALRGRFWARLSAQIYNEMDDYGRLAEAIKRIAGQ
jgi:isopenicillin-N epimerase